VQIVCGQQGHYGAVPATQIRYAVLGSGSSGNAYAFETSHSLFLIDAGFKAKEMLQRLAQMGFTLAKPMTIFCTHTHHDHLQGVGDLALHTQAVVVGGSFLLGELAKKYDRLHTWAVQSNAHYSLSEGSFSTFTTSHDAKDSMSYLLELEGLRFMVLTDTGTVLPAMYRMAYYSHVLFLEANYNTQLLNEGRYPAFLKRRVGGNKGHLSNQQAYHFLAKIAHSPHLQQVFFCHLSSDNNTPELVATEVVDQRAWPWQSHICPKSSPSDVYTVYL
jgi:phosphoribosyl 1,2-cyclic phosphodiesterase